MGENARPRDRDRNRLTFKSQVDLGTFEYRRIAYLSAGENNGNRIL